MDGKEKDVRVPPTPTPESKPSAYRVGVTCEICFVSCLEKNKKRANYENITDVEVFKQYAERWREREHEYNSVFNFVDWKNERQKMAHKSCKGSFFKDTFYCRKRRTRHSYEKVAGNLFNINPLWLVENALFAMMILTVRGV